MLLSALSLSEGFMKVTGEVGTGKTLICRKLINHLEQATQSDDQSEKYVIVYIPNPYLTPEELRLAVASELGLTDFQQQSITQAIEQQLLTLNKADKKVVMIVDEAQCLSWDTLEALRLFTNLETESKKLLQVVLFGQPELDEHLANPKVRQLRQRIGFSYQLRPMTADEVVYYINHRLTKAGAQQPLFSRRLALKIARASRGIPRLVNSVCHKVLLQAYGEGTTKLTAKQVTQAIKETEDCQKAALSPYLPLFLLLLAAILAVAVIWWMRQMP